MKDLLLPPSFGNRLTFPWLLIFRRGGEGRPPLYFLTHGRNYSKFQGREKEGFRIVGHIKDRRDAVVCCQWHNEQIPGSEAARKAASRRHQSTTSRSEIDLVRPDKPRPKPNQIILPPGYNDLKETKQ